MKAILLVAAFAITFLAAGQTPTAPGAKTTSDPSTADHEPLDLKSYGCSQHLELLETEDGRSDIVTVWAHGYYNGMRGVDEASETSGWVSVERFSEDLVRVCEVSPEKLFIRALRELAGGKR
jgi:hypothetical protein